MKNPSLYIFKYDCLEFLHILVAVVFAPKGELNDMETAYKGLLLVYITYFRIFIIIIIIIDKNVENSLSL